MTNPYPTPPITNVVHQSLQGTANASLDVGSARIHGSSGGVNVTDQSGNEITVEQSATVVSQGIAFPSTLATPITPNQGKACCISTRMESPC